MTERTTLEFRDGVAWIVMDDGKVNAMSAAMLEEIESRLAAAAAEDAVTVLAGRPGIFSAGFDMKTFAEDPAAITRMVSAGVRVIEKLLAHPRPVVTACTGHAYPMGAFLMLAADLRYGVEGDWNIGMNEVAIAITVPHFAIELARHRLTPAGYLGVGTGAMFRPEQAAAVGYLDRVVPASELDAAVQTAALSLEDLDDTSFRATKARTNAHALRDIREAWDAHGFA